MFATLTLLASLALAETPSALPLDIAKGAETLRRSAAAPRELFAIKEHKGKKVLELRPDQLDKPYLFVASIEKGTGEKGLYSGDSHAVFLIYFHKAGERLQILRKNVAHRAEPGTPESEAVAESIPDLPLGGSLELIDTRAKPEDPPPAALTIGAQEFLGKDLAGILGRVKKAYKAPDAALVDKETVLERLAAFPKNLEARVQYMFARGNPSVGGFPSDLPDSRYLYVSMHYSLSELPSSEGFEPREADARVGYFGTSTRDVGRKDLKNQPDPGVYLINRWNLEKTDPTAPVSDVKNPIVWWIDSKVPADYREAVRAGILAWNEAFEAVGLRNAIVVKDVDKDMPAEERAAFSPGNAAYNVVSWFLGDDTAHAVAQMRVDPRTGQIYSAGVRISDGITRLTPMLSGLTPEKPRGAGLDPHGEDTAFIQEAADALAVVEADGPLPPAERARFFHELVAQLTAHEIGHTLGLRHNFKAAAILALNELGKDGLVTASFMHYVSPNLAAAGKPELAFYQTRPGVYDRFAVEYGYAPLSGDATAKAAQLAAIAARADTDKRLAYGTDEDADNADPDTQRFVLGPDPVAFARHRVGLIEDFYRRLEAKAAAPDQDYARMRGAVEATMRQYKRSVAWAVTEIGGVHNRRVPGGGPAVFEPVEAARQRAALKFLDEKVFDASALRLSPELMKRLAPDRRKAGPAEIYPLGERVAAIQKDALDKIFDLDTFKRLAQAPLLARGAVTTSEVLETVRRSIWKELGADVPEIAADRRALQREHVEQLRSVLAYKAPPAKEPESRVADPLPSRELPGDARASARRDLLVIQRQIKAALATSLEAQTQAHLEDMKNAVDEALKARPSRDTARKDD